MRTSSRNRQDQWPLYKQWPFFILAFSQLLPIVFIPLFFAACQEKNTSLLNEESYEGPYIEMVDVSTLFSDSAVIRLKMTSPMQQVFENGDELYPNGLYLEIYDVNNILTTTFRSNKARKVAAENYYIGEGNVVVNNIENGDELNTEELYWYTGEKVFRTDKFVTIRSDGELHTGEGLEANQDFTYYTIKKPTGTIAIDEPIKP